MVVAAVILVAHITKLQMSVTDGVVGRRRRRLVVSVKGALPHGRSSVGAGTVEVRERGGR